jgi:hypothetical protein
MARLAEVSGHTEPIFPRESFGDLAELRVADRGAHVVIDVVDPETRPARALDLCAKLALDLLEIGLVLMQRLGGREEISLAVDERRHGSLPEDGPPAVVLPLRVERQVNPDRDRGMTLENLDRLLVPGAGKDDRYRNRKAGPDESLERHVHAVAHSGVVRADEQRDLLGIARLPRCTGLTGGERR